uniref:Ig-like domain-containing protein n=1 Tax=Anopheles atroparvus TaxID=41427 RepID=A0AAG5DBX0_ANOAO
MRLDGFVNVVLCWELMLIITAIDGKSMHEKDKHDVFSVEGVEGRSIELQCPITVPLSQVYMVLWFKDNAGIPLYSVDVRDKISRQPAHWSAPEVFGSRARFNIDKSPASLLIKNLKRHDQGIYRCRIDFRTIQTQTYRYNLSVVVLPEQPVVLDRWGRHLNGTKLGPKEEGDDVVITCRVSGGKSSQVGTHPHTHTRYENHT